MKTRIKEFRARYNLTQEELGALVNARRETISYIEKGNYNPSLLLAHRIAKQLNSTVDEVFIFEDGDDLKQKKRHSDMSAAHSGMPCSLTDIIQN